ncbi:MAG: hypothetical protein UV54_C0032G0006 [Candidatus Beckwithbacteria bacterium GW2011_GWA2_43_10]|uniref:Cupin 2 conserved barrel domain-containing protein n=1 Tax=Candidatus Beckwithbacteria bacterium GW2011_GWA2_43_10 TaxID=1618369 RepID=A0A0G1C220_9BACT|nr:MAG: hypothetical protein UV54_C0032G0006 [Candidatus Beckwithbacteria bacterium GW2011_GWA2_43_10]
MQGGWFVGDFQPTAFKTKKFEVGYKIHKKGELWPKHYHRKAIEINCLVKGKMRLNQTTLKEGDIFVIEPGEAARPKFLEECCLIVIKVPSRPKDKYAVV